MKIVLDTNVLVSGLLSPHGHPGRVLDLLLSGKVTLLHDDRILSEYREVLLRPRFGFDPNDVEILVAYLRAEGLAVASPPLPLSLPDPDDLPFLEVAVTGRADALVTGNLAHFASSSIVSPDTALSEIMGGRILSPADFISLWLARGAG